AMSRPEQMFGLNGSQPIRRLADDVPHRDATRIPTVQSPRLTRLKARRKLWLDVHLYLGLFAGLILAITGLTGSLIAFGGDIDAWLNADLMRAVPPSGPALQRPLDELFAAAQARLPEPSSPTYLNIPREIDRTVSIAYSLPSSIPDENEMDNYEVFVDPYSAEIKGARLLKRTGVPFSGPIMPLLVELHYSLLLGQSGAILFGVIAVLLIFSILTGLIVWWPLTGRWGRALTIKRRASAERLNHDLHKTSGFYSAIVLLVVLFSGVYMNLPEYITALVEIFSPAPGWPEGQKSVPMEGQAALSPGQAVALANGLFPDGELMGVGLPDGPEGSYLIRKRAPDEVTEAYPHRQVWIDQYSGRVLAVNDPHTYTAGQKFLEWQYPLHSGEAFGLPGRILILVVGLACPVLYVTGFIRWLQKRRSRRQRAGRRSLGNALTAIEPPPDSTDFTDDD
ncbi:MAG: PepSY-associated TM helix domain-containing protein, partial [Methylococcales bacterium]